MEFKDYYKILGVAEDASADEIKRAYRRLARKYHPDVSQEGDAEVRFKEINEAYEALKDPDKREAYDEVRRSPFRNGGRFEPPPGWQFKTEFPGGGFATTDAGAFSDFFRTLFGDAMPFGGGPFENRSSFFSGRGEDVEDSLEVTLEEAFGGATRQLRLGIPQRQPDGRVARQQKTLNVGIPAGVTDGRRIRLRGQGVPAPATGRPAICCSRSTLRLTRSTVWTGVTSRCHCRSRPGKLPSAPPSNADPQGRRGSAHPARIGHRNQAQAARSRPAGQSAWRSDRGHRGGHAGRHDGRAEGPLPAHGEQLRLRSAPTTLRPNFATAKRTEPSGAPVLRAERRRDWGRIRPAGLL